MKKKKKKKRRRNGWVVLHWYWTTARYLVKLATNGTMWFVTSRGFAAGRWCLQQQLINTRD
jgi:hypothetical protein